MDKDVVYRYMVEYYTFVKNKELMPFAATWMDLEITIPRQREKDKYHMMSLIYEP